MSSLCYTQVYAKAEGGSTTDPAAPPQAFERERETRLAGLDAANVSKFTEMGFEPQTVSALSTCLEIAR